MIAGIDLAWQSDKNSSGIAIGSLESSGIVVHEAKVVVSLPDVLDSLNACPSLFGVAVDAPLVIPNVTGQRECERQVSSAYGSKRASCHTSNLSRYPSAGSVKLSRDLDGRGFEHLAGEKWQLEVYPHPAIIEIFGLAERLLYKKGRVEVRRHGQAELGRLLSTLADSPVLPMKLPEHLQEHLQQDYIESLRGNALKRNEDLLDALVCLYIAGLYTLIPQGRVYGSIEEGYIYVPTRKCV